MNRKTMVIAAAVFFAAAGACADARETGFNTALHGADDFFAIFETGLTPQIPSPAGPLQGAYRVGVWYDPRPKERRFLPSLAGSPGR